LRFPREVSSPKLWQGDIACRCIASGLELPPCAAPHFESRVE